MELELPDPDEFTADGRRVVMPAPARQPSPAELALRDPQFAAFVMQQEAESKQPKPSPAEIGLRDPDFNAFVADQARERGLLTAAQAEAAKNLRWERLGNSFERAGDVVAGRQSDEKKLQGRLDEARRPVTNLAERRDVDKAGLEQATGQENFRGKLGERKREEALDDPTSQVSIVTGQLAMMRGLVPASQVHMVTGRMAPMFDKNMTFAQVEARLAEDKRQHTISAGQRERELGLRGQEVKISGARAAADKAHQERDDANAALKAGAEKKPKAISTEQQKEFAGFRTAEETMERLMQSRKTKGVGGIGSAISSAFPGTDADLVGQEAMLAAQVMGVGLEGGKLSDKEFDRYLRDFVPGPSDNDAQAENKRKNFAAYAQSKRKAFLDVARAAGHDVSTLDNGGAQAQTDAAKTTRRTHPVTRETRVWNGQAWVPEA